MKDIKNLYFIDNCPSLLKIVYKKDRNLFSEMKFSIKFNVYIDNIYFKYLLNIKWII